MNKKQHQEHLAGIARWCLSQYRGILTPTGKAKKPPTFWVLKCRDCGVLTLTSTKTAKAQRFKCSDQKLSPTKTESNGRPRTIVCMGDTTTMEEIT